MLAFALVCTLVLPSITTSEVYAQAPSKAKKRKNPYAIEQEKSKPPQMPGVTFPGPPAKFQAGFTYTGKDGSTNMSAEFKCPESAEQVVSYYSGSLKGEGWQVQPSESKTSIAATNPRLKARLEISCFSYPRSPGSTVRFSYGTTK